jgi:hypothetical protein
VYQLVSSTTKISYNSYKQFAEKKSKSGLTFEAQISYLKRNAIDDGPYGAIMDAFKFNYARENFVMTLCDNIMLQQNWDKILCDNYSKYKPKKKMAYVVTNHDNIHSFSYISGFCKHTRIPLINSKKCISNYSVPVFSKFWLRDCTFAPALFWKEIEKPIIKNLHFGTDFFITCLGLAKEWSFVHPDFSITTTKNISKYSLWYTDSILTKEYFKNLVISSKEAIVELKKNNYIKALQNLGMQDGKISPDSVLGIVHTKNANELISKYGSVADYNYWFQKFQK